MIAVQDNGTGMDYKTLHKMLSFGHCTKKEGDIGRYGNGFKSGSMRMGSDAIVFTKDGTTKSMGMLSRTFLEKTDATEVLVPMVSWTDHTGELLFVGDTKEAKFMQNSLKVIHEHSPFHGMSDIEAQFDHIEEHGTRIVIWNLRKVENSPEFELDFDRDTSDILLSDSTVEDNKNMDSETNEYLISLKMYLKILYMLPKMKFVLRGERVRAVIYPKTLHMAKTTVYRPKAHGDVKITYGFNHNRRICGMMLYNKNRLIESFLPLGIHTEHSSRGKGVMGVCDADFLQPTHNKQKFVATADYHKLKLELARRLRVYWDSCGMNGRIGSFWEESKNPDEEWIQCDACLKWRLLTKTNISLKDVDTFTCSMLGLKATERQKEKAEQSELDDACKVTQAGNCTYSKVVFLATDGKKRKIPAGREHWIGARVSLYWSSYDKWFEGVVVDYDNAKNKYKVKYDDGDLLWETYDDGFNIVTLPGGANNKNKKRKKPLESDDEDKNDEDSNERPKKKQKKSARVEEDSEDGQFESQNTIRENRMLKKKLSFIVNTLAKRGLITTDFINLVEEDNVIELDEVKLCDSLNVGSNGSNSNNNHYSKPRRNSIYGNNTNDSNSRSPLYNGDLAGDSSYVDYSGNGIEAEDPVEHNNTNSSGTAVPFIQFL
jgi:hypothetical protein